MILSGWKEIAKHVGCSVRTAQRWEGSGLPTKRPIPGRRSAVMAESGDLDSWRRDNAFWRKQDLDILGSVHRARQLREEVKGARELLRTRMCGLRKELADIREKRRPKSPPPGILMRHCS